MIAVDKFARFALVLWPDAVTPTESNRSAPSCITLDGLAAARDRRAEVMALEWDWIENEVPAVVPLHSNPRRHVDDEDDQC